MKKPQKSFAKELYPHLFFIYLALLSVLIAPLLVLNYDTAYTFFRLLQNPPFNIDDLRTINVITYFVMRVGVNCALGAKLLASLYALSLVCYAYILFLVARYVLKTKNAAMVSILLLSVCGICLLNPASGLLNGLAYFYLAYAFSESELKISEKIKNIGFIIFGLLSIVCNPWFCLILILWKISKSEISDLRKNTSKKELLTFLAGQIGMFSAFLLCVFFSIKYLPAPLDFTLSGYLSSFGLPCLVQFLLKGGFYSHFFLFIGWAYLLVRYFFRKDWKYLVLLLLASGIIFNSNFSKAAFSIDFIFSLLPLWLFMALLFAKEKKNLLFVILTLCFLCFSLYSGISKLNEKESFYSNLKSFLPEEGQKYRAYLSPIPQERLQPSALPSVEFLNYSLLNNEKPTVLLFFQPERQPMDPYVAELLLPITPGLTWLYVDLNPTYFGNLAKTNLVANLPGDLSFFKTIIDLKCGAEKITSNNGKHFFLCENWPEIAKTDGPILVERQSFEKAYEGTASVKVYKGADEGFMSVVPVQEGDSIYISVNRLGSGILSVNNDAVSNTVDTKNEFEIQTKTAVSSSVSISDTTTLWDRLEIKTVVPKNVYNIRIRVLDGIKSDTSYFDNLRFKLTRSVL